jgi:hypothetical protein
MSGNDDYEIGYGRPPKIGRFKKGQSGNPKGRPKGVRNFQMEVADILRSRVTVTEAGKPKSIGTVEAALMRLKEKALKGDQRALEALLAYAQEISSASDARSRERQLSKLEMDIIGRSGLIDGADEPGGSGDE